MWLIRRGLKMSKVSRKKLSTLRSVIRKEMRWKSAAPSQRFQMCTICILHFQWTRKRCTRGQRSSRDHLLHIKPEWQKVSFNLNWFKCTDIFCVYLKTIWFFCAKSRVKTHSFLSIVPLPRLVWGFGDIRDRKLTQLKVWIFTPKSGVQTCHLEKQHNFVKVSFDKKFVNLCDS